MHCVANKTVNTCHCWAAVETVWNDQRALSAGQETVTGCGGEACRGSDLNGLMLVIEFLKYLLKRRVFSHEIIIIKYKAFK